MIAKIKRNLSLGDTIGYNLKEESQLIDAYNLKGNSVEDYILQMELTQKQFTGRAKNLTAHIILSPSIEDGKLLTPEKVREIAYRHLVRMELNKNQALVFLHEDKAHVHLHIVVNRINKEGKIYRTRENEMIRCQRSGNSIAKELGMRQAGSKEREHINHVNEEGLFSEIQKDCNSARLLSGPPKHLVFNLDRYFEQLILKGYKIKKYHHSKTNLIYGYGLIGSDNRFYKASEIGDLYSVKNLIAQSSKNKRELLKIKMSQDLKELQSEIKTFNIESYFRSICEKGYEVKPHFERDTSGTETAIIRGYSIGKDSVFISASELSPELTLKKLKQIKPQIGPTVRQSKQQEEDILKITSILFDLTNGHRYSQEEDFIKALESQKLKVNLRYNNGELAGYKISLRGEKYNDNEVNLGAYSLVRLRAKGIIKTTSKFEYPNRPIELSYVMKTAVDEINIKNIQEAIRKSKNTIPKIKTLTENDLARFIQSMMDYGFKVKLHFAKNKNGGITSYLRGYSVGVDNEFYNAFTLGKEFTISSLLEQRIVQNKKSNQVSHT